MHIVEPRIFVIAETRRIQDELQKCLTAIGAEGWTTDVESDAEGLAEFAGRLCYKAFGTELNKNLTKVREGNYEYIGNIIKQEHGSVLEHASTSVAMIGVSRILTHELVRHRQGTAYSQESMRFVRMEDIGMYVPDLSNEFDELATHYVETDDHNYIKNRIVIDYLKAMESVTEFAEQKIMEFTAFLDKRSVPFKLKKSITSALRRMAPSGHTTNILATGNHRAWRFMIQQRTSVGAEREIRELFGKIARDFKVRYPAFYQDMDEYTLPDKTKSYRFIYHKI